ncbi:MAG: META domain-containing protein [Tannerellaceae bacterium]|jgi:heat shock protein HslJ|nr:META domain-containing protein [Tannerellaceae bacterium]
MKKHLYTTLAIVCVGLAVGCKSKKATMVAFSDLEGEWNIVEMNGGKLDPEETRQLVVFDVDRQTLSGYAGCNRMSCQIDHNESQKNRIKFSKIVSTRMACMDMRYEHELLKTLDKVVRFGVEDDAKPLQSIAFYGADDTKLLVIGKK